MASFLLKTEPGDYSLDDLERDGATVWDGITNNAALMHMRTVRKGDDALIYHTGGERSVVGLAQITSDPHADPGAGDPKVVVFDVEFRQRAASPISLAQIKGDERFAGFDLVRQPRLSVMPVPEEIDRLLRQEAGLKSAASAQRGHAGSAGR